MADKILFIDRDGTVIHEPEDFQVDRLDKVRLVDDVIRSLQVLRDHGYRFVMVTNQDGLGTDAFPQAHFDAPHALVMSLFETQGIRFDEVMICPHLPEQNCECRKPRTGLLTRFLAANDIDLSASAVIGDRQTDMELAERIGVNPFLLEMVNIRDQCSWVHAQQREAAHEKAKALVRMAVARVRHLQH